ncbi:MAG TPA: hypothetical protein PKE63_13790 [Lacibacter sp.]|nr:hypothetical protein [Lacibacter sp.]HMO90106.1 hypothetical protein [Lacibacter sp.]HMP88346.1 hypothetical protein [Lacibacter sp.]
MIRPVVCCALVFLLIACRDQPRREEPAAPPQVQWFDTDTIVVWNCDASRRQRIRVYTPPDSVPLVQPFINGINRTWPEAELQLVALNADTVVVTLRNTGWLTARAGNTGAEQYLAFASLNLLEAQPVHFIRFDLPRGVHAGPSVWGRADFLDWITTDTLSTDR